MAGANATGIRCEYTESLVPLDLDSLVADINAIVNDDGVSISDDSAVVVEAYGGNGHDGRSIGHIHAGSGGDRGYASTLLTLSEVLDISQNQADLYIYVGQDGPEDQAGGSSSVVIGKNIFGVSNILNPAGENVLCIGAGGGGGGKGTQTGAGKKRNGYDGGAGGGRGGDHKGGGGGGGGWARQETVVSAAVRSDFILGPSFDPGYAVIYITFELVDAE